MGMSRGATGSVRGINATIVRDIFLDALEHFAEGEEFTRQEWREAMRKAALQGTKMLSKDDLHALEHAFWRTVAPVAAPGRRGVYLMPRHAAALVHHRGFRVSGGKHNPSDLLQLMGLLRWADEHGYELTPNLARLRKVGTAALRTLGLPVQGTVERV